MGDQYDASKESPTSPSARYNQVDLTYRTELRELNELNFARFDAKVGERLAELRSELQAVFRSEMDMPPEPSSRSTR